MLKIQWDPAHLHESQELKEFQLSFRYTMDSLPHGQLMDGYLFLSSPVNEPICCSAVDLPTADYSALSYIRGGGGLWWGSALTRLVYTVADEHKQLL